MLPILRRAALLWFFILISASHAAAQTPERYSRAEILFGGRSPRELAALGIETDHGQFRHGYSLTSDFSAAELERVRAAGFTVNTLIDDVVAHYATQNDGAVPVEARGGGCYSANSHYPVPVNYTDGSMGGYHTYAELLAVLDSMHARFPALITPRQMVSSTIMTHEGRPVWYVKVSDNPGTDEPEPKVLYTALHHAREPNSMAQMLYFLWYLLENYATDSQVQYILAHTQLYFIPCVNPDGYIYNQTIAPNGGGYWRKNRRVNGDGTRGVDLNRNYGYNWAWDDIGSSSWAGDETYRGPSAFSEPETRIVRDFGLEHQFIFALNYHTAGNLLIYPWNYSDQLAEPIIGQLADIMRRENGYHPGTPGQTVGYQVNGNSDDWFYGATGAYAYTPEVGTNFWPPFSQIAVNNQKTVWMNLFTALATTCYGEVQDQSGEFVSEQTALLPFTLTRYGLVDSPLTVVAQPLTANILSISPPKTLSAAQFQPVADTFQLELSPSIAPGDTICFVYALSNGSFRDTIAKIYGGDPAVAFSETGTNLQAWSGNWGVTNLQWHSPPSSITDSPDGNYTPGAVSTASAVLAIPADASSVRLRFFARWAMYYGDYAQVTVTTQTGETIALCGRYTEPGTEASVLGQPVYRGFNDDDWLEEVMSLSDFAGQTITLSFSIVSDAAAEYDGFYFDDLTVEYFLSDSGTSAYPVEQLQLQAVPNPARAYTAIRWQNIAAFDPAELTVSDVMGRLLLRQTVAAGSGQVRVDTHNWPAGLYRYTLRTDAGQEATGKLSKY